MDQTDSDVFECYIVPLILSEHPGLKKQADSKQAIRFRQKLAEDFHGKLMSVDDVREILKDGMNESVLSEFNRPCIFLIYFSEHDSITKLYSTEMMCTYLHVCSISMFFFLPTISGSPLKIKMEELYYTNYGKPFRIYNIKEDWEKSYTEKRLYLTEQLTAIQEVLGADFHRSHRALFSDNRCLFMLPYLRIFRENCSISMFYASIEFFLMVIHTMALFQFRILKNITENGMEGFQAADDISVFETTYNRTSQLLLVPKKNLSDGIILDIFKLTSNALREFTPFADCLAKILDDDVIETMNDLLQTLGLSNRLKKQTSWFEFLQRIIEIRNVTKGHGILYYIDNNLLRTMTSAVFKLTEDMCDIEGTLNIISEENFYQPEFNPVFYFSTLKTSDKEWLFLHRPYYIQGDRHLCLWPEILYSTESDFFLFCGFSDDHRHMYHKNYATGLYVSHDVENFTQGDI